MQIPPFSTSAPPFMVLLHRSLLLLLGTMLAFGAFSQSTLAQWPPKEGPGWLDLKNLAVAKMTKSTEGEEQVSIIVPMFYQGTQEVSRTVEITEEKTGTRNVIDPKTGQTRQESYIYTVSVPRSETMEVTYEAFEKGHRTDIPLDRIVAHRLDGAEIESAQLAKLLSQSKQVFVFPNYVDYTPDPFYIASLNPNLLILFLKESDYAGHRGPPPQAAQPAVPAPAAPLPVPAA